MNSIHDNVASERIIENKNDLLEYFFDGCKSRETWRIGAEYESILVYNLPASLRLNHWVSGYYLLLLK